MRTILVFLLINVLPCTAAFAQITLNGRVVDSKTNEPLAFVHLVPHEMRDGTTSDIDGRFSITVAALPVTLHFSYVGYSAQEVVVTADGPLLVRMQRGAVELREVDITPTENPAHRIIKQVYANRKVNDGLRNFAHRYKSYSKVIFTADMDSTIMADPEKFAALDTSDRDAIEFLEKQYILLIESVTAKRFIPPAAEQEEVLAMRVSGLKDPSLLAMVASTKTFSVYEPQIQVNERTYLSPIGPGSTKQYLFILQDTLYQGKDSVFVISYQPRSGKNFEALKGVLWVTTDGYALQNVIAEPVEREGGANIKLQQQFERVTNNGTSTWFPVQLNTFVYFDMLQINSMKMVAIGRSYLKEIELEPVIERKDVRGPDLIMEKVAGKRDDAFWNGYRTDTLDTKELRTYHTIDSISAAENLETKLKWAERLLSGRIPVGPFDLLLDRFMRLNDYEGYRLGLGVTTNDKVSRYFSLGGYFAYGFKDKEWKYGGDLTLKPRPGRDLNLKLGYLNDVDESGNTDLPGKKNLNFSSENYRSLFISRMDRIERFSAELGFRINSSLRAWVGTERAERLNVIGYQYAQPAGEGVTTLQDRFLTGAITAGFRFAYREQIVRLPDRQYSLGTRWPVLQVQVFRAVKGLWDGEMDTWRVFAQLDKTFRIRRFGDLSVRAIGGVADPNAPYPFLFNPRATFLRRIPIAAQNTFETMRPNEFLSDNYASVHLRHSFGNLLYKGRKFRPVPILVASAGWGGLSKPENHRGYSFSSMAKGFYEGGIQVDQLLKTNLVGLGIGAFYRFGPYTLNDPIDNLAIKLSLSVGI